tara:strand:- start:5193 stop:5900 length:708 start_codon:yes stop_codon:yes gene_type:complete
LKNKKNLKIILQARTMSSRLCAKSLLPLANIPLAVLCAKRLSNTGYPVVAVIPKDKTDDELCAVLKSNGIRVFRGNQKNVLSRYIQVSKNMKDDDLIVRATADNPFPDGNFIKEMVSIFHKLNREYMCTHDRYFHLPFGLAVQIFKSKYLKSLKNKNLSKNDKEHVVLALARDKINTKYVGKNLNYKKYYTNKKLSLDTIEDYITIAKIFSMTKKPVKEKWQKLIKKNNVKKIKK